MNQRVYGLHTITDVLEEAKLISKNTEKSIEVKISQDPKVEISFFLAKLFKTYRLLLLFPLIKF